MALVGNTADFEFKKFIESDDVAGLPGVVVLNPDGSSIGGGASTGTIDLLKAGTISRVEQGSINVTAGTIGTVANVGVIHNAGTLASGSLANLAMIHAGTLTNSGTTTGVGTVTNLGSVTNIGVIHNAGTLATGSLANIAMLHGGTVIATGNVAHDAADSGNPIKIGLKYNATPPSVTDGDRVDAQGDASGNQKVTQATQTAGEDLTNDVLGIMQKPVSSATYAPSEHMNLGAAAGTGSLVKSSPGNVLSAYVTSGTSAIRYFQLFNQGSVPVVGQTPVASYPMGSVTAGGIYELKLDSAHFAPSRWFSTGIAAAMSSTQGTLGTASITIADYNWHIKYV